MRNLIFIALLLAATGCVSRIPTAPLKTESDELRVQLMRAESEVYGDFFKLRNFHNDLFQSINNANTDPYPALDKMYDSLFAAANRSIAIRVNYDTTYWKIQNEIKDKKKVPLTDSFRALIELHASFHDTLPNRQSHFRENYFRIRSNYQDSCRNHGIIRYNPQDYSAILNEKLTQWQDSLEEVGRLIAQCKLDLKQRFPQQKGKEFFAAYAPVSELEAMMKNFESILNQLQNSISRFEEGNNQDFIYFGPQIRQRLEVAANDDLIGQLSIQMKDCRTKREEYFSQKSN